jgi:hypothetical protein
VFYQAIVSPVNLLGLLFGMMLQVRVVSLIIGMPLPAPFLHFLPPESNLQEVFCILIIEYGLKAGMM